MRNRRRSAEVESIRELFRQQNSINYAANLQKKSLPDRDDDMRTASRQVIQSLPEISLPNSHQPKSCLEPQFLNGTLWYVGMSSFAPRKNGHRAPSFAERKKTGTSVFRGAKEGIHPNSTFSPKLVTL